MKTVIMDENTHKRLKVLSAILGKNIKELLVEASNLLFDKYQEEIKNGGIYKE